MRRLSEDFGVRHAVHALGLRSMGDGPVAAGFHPDPSVTCGPDGFYLVNSTFEYLPGLPVHHSRDLKRWRLIGHVVKEESIFQLDRVPTGGGAWAPSIRWHDGLFYLVTPDVFGR